jgi:hypothetical protein
VVSLQDAVLITTPTEGYMRGKTLRREPDFIHNATRYTLIGEHGMAVSFVVSAAAEDDVRSWPDLYNYIMDRLYWQLDAEEVYAEELMELDRRDHGLRPTR